MRGELDAAEVMTDSLEAYFGGGRGRSGALVYGALLAVLTGATVALALVRVDVTARAPGLLRPALERHRVAAGASGMVELVGARVGAHVHAGDLLLTLRPGALGPRLAAAESSASALRARAADLSALIRFAGSLAASGRDRSGLLGPGRRRTAADAPRLARYQEERRRLVHEWTDLVREESAARGEAARARSLGRLGLAAPAEIEQATLRLARAEAGPRQLAERQESAWGQELEDVLGQLRQAEGERSSLAAEARLNELRAPVSGTVEEWSPLSPGSWIAAGQQVAVISPDAPLVAEVFVDSRDAARVGPGMRVRLLLDAFDHHEWGTLPARVSEVADDYTLVDGRPAFRVRCQLLALRLRRPGGGEARPGKGMALTAAFVLGRRTLLHLLWDRASRPFGEEAGPGRPSTISRGGPAARPSVGRGSGAAGPAPHAVSLGPHPRRSGLA